MRIALAGTTSTACSSGIGASSNTTSSLRVARMPSASHVSLDPAARRARLDQEAPDERVDVVAARPHQHPAQHRDARAVRLAPGDAPAGAVAGSDCRRRRQPAARRGPELRFDAQAVDQRDAVDRGAPDPAQHVGRPRLGGDGKAAVGHQVLGEGERDGGILLGDRLHQRGGGRQAGAATAVLDGDGQVQRARRPQRVERLERERGPGIVLGGAGADRRQHVRDQRAFVTAWRPRTESASPGRRGRSASRPRRRSTGITPSPNQ